MTAFLIRACILLLGIFFDFATCFLVVTGIALVWPGSFFDVVWALKPARCLLFLPWREWLGPLLLVSVIPAAAVSYGLLMHRNWGRQLAIVILGANLFGDAVQMTRGHLQDAAIVGAMAGAVILFLRLPKVRQAFDPS